MKKTHWIFFLIIFLFNRSEAQTSAFWLQEAGGGASDEGYDIASDLWNNVYASGYFSNTVRFGTDTLHSAGAGDIYICKLDTGGRYVWAVRAGGPLLDKGISVTTDNAANVYVTGFFAYTATFDTNHVTAHGLQDMFVAKYDSAGNLIWINYGGGPYNDQGNGVAVDDFGNVYVTGQFIDTAHFGPFVISSKIDSVSGLSSMDVFTAKYNSAGVIQWIKKGSSRFSDRGLDVGCDHAGNVYVTGQFSDTVTFENTHNNASYNAVFLIKYDPNGNEMWFRKAGGGYRNIAYCLAVDDNADVFLGGDFNGHVNFYAGGVTQLTSTYAEGVFVAKFDSSGNLSWVQSNSSENTVTCRGIALDDSSNAYVTGTFQCIFSGLSDTYGSGCFNSIGYNDVYISKFNSSGNWQLARNFGSINDDFARGVCVTHDYKPKITGSFHNVFCVPMPLNYNIPATVHYNGTKSIYQHSCNDSSKWTSGLSSYGNLDVFIINPLSARMKPLYFYNTINDTNCTRPTQFISIDNDTAVECGQYIIHSSPNLGGPSIDYHWSGGLTVPSPNERLINTTGWYSVTVASDDSCFISTDSIYVIINPLPIQPLLTDSKGVNINTNVTHVIPLCKPDSVYIFSSDTNSLSWYFGSNFSTDTLVIHSDTLSAPYSYTGHLYATDLNGCTNTTSFTISLDTALRPVHPIMHLPGDTIHLCSQDQFTAYVYDSLSDPGALDQCNNVFQPSSVSFYVGLSYTGNLNCNSSITISPLQSGWCLFECEMERITTCGVEDTVRAIDSIYVDLMPAPIVNATLTGPNFLCIGDSILLTASSGDQYLWYGSISGSTNTQSVYVTGPGYVQVMITDSNSYGCFNTDTASMQINSASSPVITMSPASGLICPNDSVQFNVTNSGTYQWYGPGGPMGNAPSVYGSLPGDYYCIVISAGCSQATNVLSLEQYATPFVDVTPAEFICPGNTVHLHVVANPGDTILWQSPFSGNSLNQTVNAPGVYTCDITSCGLTIPISTTIAGSNATATITPAGPMTLCPGDSLTLSANSGMVFYEWQPVGYDPTFIVHQPGSYTVVTTDVYGCTVSSSPVLVSLASVPVASITPVSPLCIGQTLQLTVTSPGANVQWSGPNSFSSSSFTPSLTSVNVADSGWYSVTATQSGCSTLDSIHVSVDSIPPFSPSSNSPLCSGDTLQLFSSPSASTLVQWSGPGGFTSSTINTSIFPVHVSNAGNYIIQVTEGACITQSVIAVTVDSIASVSISASLPVCSGDTLRFNSSTSSSALNWSGPNNFSSSISSPFIYPVHTVDSGIYTVSGVQGNCSTQSSMYVSVDSLPDIILTIDMPVCINEDHSMRATEVFSASYAWVEPSGNFSASNPLIFNPLTASDTGMYHLKTILGGCQSEDSLFIHANECKDETDTVIKIPNVFTPDGDGLNDFFKINNKDIEQLHGEIFNRWGEKIYTWDGANGYWDGTNGHSRVTNGTYYYIIELKLYNKTMQLFKGTVEVMYN